MIRKIKKIKSLLLLLFSKTRTEIGTGIPSWFSEPVLSRKYRYQETTHHQLVNLEIVIDRSGFNLMIHSKE